MQMLDRPTHQREGSHSLEVGGNLVNGAAQLLQAFVRTVIQ
jgi:hypothetical protein